jgi:glycosyltransferase involved in cell wall biosynthesis
MKNIKKIKLALVTNIPTPYRKDLFNSLSSSYKITCKVFFSGKTEKNRYWNISNLMGFPHTVINSLKISRRNGSTTYFEFGLFKALKKFKPDAIIVGGASFSAIICALYKFINPCGIYNWWAGTALSEKKRHPIIKLYRKWLFYNFDGFFAYSMQSKEYLQKMHISKDKIHVIGNNTIDVNKYCGSLIKAKKKCVKDTGKSLTLLVVGQLIKRKNVITVLETFSMLSRKYHKVKLNIIGLGPEESQLKQYCKSNKVKNVYFLGNIQPEKLIKYYVKADVLISIALMDQWPQVVNESMAFGLPVIVSTTSGIDATFLKNGVNGFRLNPLNKMHLYEILETFIKNPEYCRIMGEKAFETASAYDVNYVKKIIENVLAYQL